MTSSYNTRPITFFFLLLPYGISSGFLSVTLPFLLTRYGFPVALTASITAFGISANIWRFVWAPLADLTLSLHQWYLIGLGFCVTAFVSLSFIPLNNQFTGVLTLIVFLTQIAATFIMLPVGGFMAKTVADGKKGRAGGWFQAGNLGGMGAGGGAGVWLSSHVSYQVADVLLAFAMMSCAAALYFVPQVPAIKEKTFKESLKLIVIDFRDMISSPVTIFTMAVILMPIGIGAAVFLWSSVATDWQVTSADTVALVTGMMSGIVSAAGAVLGGWVADKIGRWWALFGMGILMAAVTLLMRYIPFTPATYIGGVLTYAFIAGIGYAAFLAVVLHVIGQQMASTKFALLNSLGYIPLVYMTAFDGWLHDKYGVRAMLLGETFLGFGCILLFLLIFSRLKLN